MPPPRRPPPPLRTAHGALGLALGPAHCTAAAHEAWASRSAASDVKSRRRAGERAGARRPRRTLVAGSLLAAKRA
ncbi:hypothetical protein R5R35_013216 [Gryllus longicercus]|uniref:Uncharacterized protein n=1 Tax=Gryllus longicercus TaxID=2509291 RepID=A0AAN9W5D5_9ORTH